MVISHLIHCGQERRQESLVWGVLHRNCGAHKISNVSKMILAIPHAQLLCAIEELQWPICFGVLQLPIKLPCNRFMCATFLIE